MDATTDRARALLSAARKASAGRRKYLIAGGLALAALGLWFMLGRGPAAEPYRTAAADRGAITRVVSATGALQPLVSVNVGSTVSGLVETVDLVGSPDTVADRMGEIMEEVGGDGFLRKALQGAVVVAVRVDPAPPRGGAVLDGG